jgi:hypothetical protein
MGAFFLLYNTKKRSSPAFSKKNKETVGVDLTITLPNG